MRNNIATSYTVNLPFDHYIGRGDIAQRFTAGWSLAGLATFASGQPVQLSESDDRDLIGDNSFRFSMINHLPGDSNQMLNNSNPRKGQAYFSPSYFSKDALGQVGNASRRFFSGPGIDNYDLSLLKDTKITEGSQLQFRFEAFNVFNHAAFNNPTGNIDSGTFGYVTSSNSQIGPRIMQAALKYIF